MWIRDSDGTITIASVSGEAADAARARIESITADVEVGKVYDGTVLKPVSYTHLPFLKQHGAEDGACFSDAFTVSARSMAFQPRQ